MEVGEPDWTADGEEAAAADEGEGGAGCDELTDAARSEVPDEGGGAGGVAPAGAEAMHEAQQSYKPLRERIGLRTRRHERGEWKTLLLAPTTLHEQGRDSELDLKILRGDITADVRVYVLQQDKRIVSFLLSSTFTDTEWERNLLIDDVVPYLQDYARKHGFEFRLAEMRW